MERRRAAATGLLILTGLAAGMWLFALAEPGNLGGVIMLEALTAPCLLAALWWRRRQSRRLAELPQSTPARVQTPEVVALMAPPLPYDPVAPHELVLRPRAPWKLAFVLLPLGFIAWLVKVSYDEAEIIPQLWFLVVQYAFISILVFRARVVIAGGALWRRSMRKYAGVDLADLQSIEVARASYLKNEGLIRAILRVRDGSGRMIKLKPTLWSKGARPLLAGLDAVARDQGLAMDQRTSEALARAASHGTAESHWAASVGLHGRLDLAPPAPASSTFWVRRDVGGAPARARPIVIIGSIGVAALLVAAAIVASQATDRWLRAGRCDRDRHLWTPAPQPATSPAGDLEAVAGAVGVAGAAEGTSRLFRLDPSALANEHNTKEVQRASKRLLQGVVVQWLNGPNLQSEVYIERFDSPASARQFQHFYGDDHCRNDKAFAVREIAGAVGFRCRCGGETVNDRVSFVTDDVRVQSIVWTVPEGDGHERAVSLAETTLGLLGG